MTIPLADRLKTALSGRYAIERELGAGGMATVHLAQDVKHRRQVAVKVLKPELAAVIGAERFLQEIHVTAHLQHPHILPLFDSGEADAFLFYVMPYLEGESLRDRLAREKQLPVEDAVQITTEVAAALSYAHSRGVIHRDIKPENVLLTGGAAVVADFGIARAVTAAGGGRLTETGLSLGTPQYMSPEQATADRELDGRSDIYSLGCVLYEMLAGEPPYTGPTTQSVIAKVLTEEPRAVRLSRPTVPPHVEAAVHKALAKLPADRFATASQFMEALSKPGLIPVSPAAPLPMAWMGVRSWLSPTWKLAALGLAIAVAGLLVGTLLGTRLVPRSGPPPVIRFTVVQPPNSHYANAYRPSVAVSPDGSYVVYTGEGKEGYQLFVRRLGQLSSEPIPATKDGYNPFFSPDGTWLGYVAFSERRLMKIRLAGGSPVAICSLESPYVEGASWGPRGTIIFGAGGRLYRVEAAGGRPEAVAAPDTAVGESHRWPGFLPGGETVLITVHGREGDRLASVRLATGQVTDLGQPGSNPQFVEPGWLAFTGQGTLEAAPFDKKQVRLTGSPVALARDVGMSAVSPGGTVAYVARVSLQRRLVLVDRNGVARNVGLEPEVVQDPRLSPDGRQLAATVDHDGGAQDIWIYDLGRHTRTRLTFDRTGTRPIWTPDGHRIIYSPSNQSYDLYWVPADGPAAPEPLLLAPDVQHPGDITPDGRTLVYRSGGAGAAKRSLWYLSLVGDRTPRQLLANGFENHSPSLSPDGRWMAYVSDESGRLEVYVRSFPGPGGRWQVSLEGGTQPRWSPTGQEIFYRAGDSVMAVAVRTQPSFTLGDRVQLFEGAYFGDAVYPQYDVTRDGRSFVMVKPETENQDIVVVVNWFAQARFGGVQPEAR